MNGATEAAVDVATSSSYSRAWVEIDLGALLRNASKIATSAQVPLLPW